MVTLPVYKDTSFLEKACDVLEDITPRITPEFILLIAEDGSNSSALVSSLKQRYSNIVYTQHDQRLGRGKALREAWSDVEGDVYVFLDVDLATDLGAFDAYRNLVKSLGKFDLVTGSRYIRGSVTNRPKLRRFASIIYNSLIRLMFRTGVHDHQCGFKSFSKQLVQVLDAEAKSDSWFWDTEVIVLAKRSGFKVLEIPVKWTERKGSRTPLTRLVKDVWLHGVGMVRLLWRVYATRWNLLSASGER